MHAIPRGGCSIAPRQRQPLAARAVRALGVGAFAVAMAAGTAAPASGGEPSVAVVERLRALPSPPGPHVRRLADLAEETWLDLGAPAPDPRWGRARGRTWTSHMAYAASLGAAFLFGEGRHGWVNSKTGRYMDDLWLYDVMAHRWVNAYPGFDARDPAELELNADGFPAVAGGGPLPVATMVHGYHMTAWDPVARTFLAMPNLHTYFREPLPTVARFLDGNRDRLNSRFAGPWMFDVASGTWDRKRTPTKSPRSGYGDTLVYLPSLDRFLFRHIGEVWLYDAREVDWTRLRPGGPPPPFGIEPTACHDEKRDRVYIGGGRYPSAPGRNALWIYDVGADAWIDPRPGGVAVGTNYTTNDAMLHCDPVADVVLLFRYRGANRGVFAYDPDENAWAEAPAGLPRAWPDTWRTEGSSGFYDPTLNVHLFHVAGDSIANGRILAYRHRRR